jgi:hypothetical protein
MLPKSERCGRMKPFGPDYSATVSAGRAYIRVIEAATVLAEWEDDNRSRAKWRRVRREAQEYLRKLVMVLPPAVTAEIMVARQKALGTVRDFGRN